MSVIITGAASGIGRSTANILAAQSGAKLLLVDRDAERLDQAAAELSGPSNQVVALAADLSDPASAAVIVEAAVAKFGGLDGLVSNAGIIQATTLMQSTAADFDRMFGINTRPTWALAQAAYPHLVKSRGAIVATASLSAENATPSLGFYSASKAALVMIVKQLALELGPDGIRVNAVSPGPTLTEMTAKGYADEERRRQRESTIPLRRLNAPEDIANAIVFLLSPLAAGINGVNLMVDGGINEALMPATGSGSGQASSR